jgi:tetratricopeptide (TPR) repeat protein
MDQNALETLLKNVTGVEEALTTIRGSLIERGLDPNDKDILYDIAVSLREMIAAAAGTSPEAKAKVVLYYDVAVSLLKEAARGDHAEAQYELGLVFYNSASFENTDYLEAANYFKRAIKNKCKYDAFHMYCKLQGKIKREQSSLYSSSANESPKVQKLRSSARMVLIFQESAMKERGLTDITQHLKFNKDLYDELKVAINNLKTNNTGGCFVATAVYGSYEAEEVRVLRQFRDLVLLRHKLTAWTVWFYYKVGPKLASVVSRSPRLRLNTKRILDRVVSLVDKYMK